ncbi:MAG TPA: 50S ribosomal protein L10 [Chthoniobacterales bacterium]|nr:50S ribosomal protein L10 [Chthoniobacterales bacterium]
MRPEKATIVSDLAEKLNRSPFLLITDYQRMKVDQFGELRSRLAPAGAEVRVVKNSFLKRAMADSGMPDVADKLTGQTAIVMGENDVAPVAKILKLFAAEFKIASLKIGVVDKSILSTSDVEALAELPSREILLSRLLGLLLAPATSLVRVLNEPASAFARLLKAKGEQGEASQAAAAPAAETPSPAPSTEEAPTAAAPEAKEEAPVAETKQEAPVAETKEEAPAAEQTSEAPAETPAAESTTGEKPTENPA